MSRLPQLLRYRVLAEPGYSVSKLCAGLFMLLLMAQFSLAQAVEIKDPMQPPAYAMKKYREAKNKDKPAPVSTVGKEKKEIKKLKLTSIIYSSTRKIAIIDDQMLGVGGTINGAKVVKINKRSARLVKKGKVINLRLPDDDAAIRKTLVESET